MKILFISILFLLFMINLSAQPFNQKMIDRNGNQMLIGCCTREAFLQEPFATWYIKNYNDYFIDTVAANEIRKNISNKQFILFLGTWCGDSRRETPRILKIFDYCNVNP